MDEILGGDIGKEYKKMEELLKEKTKNIKRKENNNKTETEIVQNRVEESKIPVYQEENNNMNSFNQISFKENNVNFQSLNLENFDKF